MTFFDQKHQDMIDNLNKDWKGLAKLEKAAANYGILDILQDNGAKVLQQLVLANFDFLPGREGNDAIDENGVEWELKSVNIDTKARGFSTDHHTTFELLDRFNSVPWLFSIYRGTKLDSIYITSPGDLSDWIDKQKNLLTSKGVGAHLNNPKIPIKFVKTHGKLFYPFTGTNIINPADYDQ